MRPVANKTNLNTIDSKNTDDTQLHRLEPIQEVWAPTGIVDRSIGTEPVFQTALGVLYEGDCTTLLPAVLAESIDTIFADPPFNLAKKYGMKVDDARPDNEYVQWSKQWLDECIRALKPRGAIFIYNLPKWNIILGNHLVELGLDFRHWIAVNIKLSLPIPGRLYPKLDLDAFFFPELAPELAVLKEWEQKKSEILAMYPQLHEG
jgi:hypothetical protein